MWFFVLKNASVFVGGLMANRGIEELRRFVANELGISVEELTDERDIFVGMDDERIGEFLDTLGFAFRLPNDIQVPDDGRMTIRELYDSSLGF